MCSISFEICVFIIWNTLFMCKEDILNIFARMYWLVNLSYKCLSYKCSQIKLQLKLSICRNNLRCNSLQCTPEGIPPEWTQVLTHRLPCTDGGHWHRSKSSKKTNWKLVLFFFSIFQLYWCDSNLWWLYISSPANLLQLWKKISYTSCWCHEAFWRNI